MQKISIIIPVYNTEKYIEKCIESVLNQTYKNLEIILINDGSTDGSGDICNKYANGDNRVKVLHKENEGLSPTRNLGISNSTGEYILFLDSDDWLDINTCFLAMQAAQKNNVDLVFWSYVREYKNLSLPKKVIDTKKNLVIFEELDVQNYLKRRLVGLVKDELRRPEDMDSLVTATMKLYRTEIIHSNKIFFVDTKKIGTEDMLFNLMLFKFIKKAIYLNEDLYHYRRDNENSLTRTTNLDLIDKWKNLFEIMRNHLKENKLEGVFWEAYTNRICLSFIGLGMIVSRNDEISLKKKLNLLSDVLNDLVYKSAFEKLSLKHFDLKWKTFFYCAKFKIILPVYFMLRVMVYKTSR